MTGRLALAKTLLRWLLAFLMVAIGVDHFWHPGPFVSIVPAALPNPLLLVHVSGFFEVLGGLGILVPPVRRLAGWGLILLYVAVFPANVNMAVNKLPMGDHVLEAWQLWGRLPLQAVFIAWAWWCTRDEAKPAPAAKEHSSENEKSPA